MIIDKEIIKIIFNLTEEEQIITAHRQYLDNIDELLSQTIDSFTNNENFAKPQVKGVVDMMNIEDNDLNPAEMVEVYENYVKVLFSLETFQLFWERIFNKYNSRLIEIQKTKMTPEQLQRLENYISEKREILENNKRVMEEVFEEYKPIIQKQNNINENSNNEGVEPTNNQAQETDQSEDTPSSQLFNKLAGSTGAMDQPKVDNNQITNDNQQIGNNQIPNNNTQNNQQLTTADNSRPTDQPSDDIVTFGR